MIRGWSCINKINLNTNNNFILSSKINIFKNNIIFKNINFKITKYKRIKWWNIKFRSNFFSIISTFKMWVFDYISQKLIFKYNYYNNSLLFNYFLYQSIFKNKKKINNINLANSPILTINTNFYFKNLINNFNLLLSQSQTKQISYSQFNKLIYFINITSMSYSNFDNWIFTLIFKKIFEYYKIFTLLFFFKIKNKILS